MFGMSKKESRINKVEIELNQAQHKHHGEKSEVVLKSRWVIEFNNDMLYTFFVSNNVIQPIYNILIECKNLLEFQNTNCCTMFVV